MRDLVLVAASGLAREVLEVERDAGRYRRILLVDDDPRLWDTRVDGAPVVGPVERAADLDADLLVCAGRGTARRDLVRRLAGLGVAPTRYARTRHPAAQVPPSCTVGAGSILLGHVVLTTGVRVGRHVVVMPGVTLTHDDVLHDHATLCAGVSLGGHVTVGEAAYLGMNACVRERVTIGAGATLGMGSALLRDQPAGETWYGVPAAPAPSRGRGATAGVRDGRLVP